MELREENNSNDSSAVNSDDSDNKNYKKMKNEIKNKDKKKKNLGEIIGNLLNKKTTKDPILANHTLPFKKLEDEKNEHEKLLSKKREKFVQRRIGFLPCAEWNKKDEKNLVKITTKGVVKLFNSIFQFRKKIKDDKEIEDLQKEKKSTNFLLMHNLDPEIGKINKSDKKEKRTLDKTKSSKKFQEDI